MPQSFVINLVPEISIPQKYLTGQYFYDLFLRLVSSVDAELGQILQADSQNKSFTLGPLQISNTIQSQKGIRNLRFLPSRKPIGNGPLQYQYQNDVPAGTHCWWRIVLLDDELFGHLSREWERNAPHLNIYLGPSKLQITNLLRNPQTNPNWVSRCNYQKIYEEASNQNREIHLQFLTPAIFRQGGFESTMPTSDAIFQSLRRQWNRYSGLAFAPSMVTPIIPGQFELKTVTLQDQHTKMMGCLGNVSFNILGEVDPLTIKRINTLADFTLYCGVGRKTNLGMGIVRRIVPSLPHSS